MVFLVVEHRKSAIYMRQNNSSHFGSTGSDLCCLFHISMDHVNLMEGKGENH